MNNEKTKIAVLLAVAGTSPDTLSKIKKRAAEQGVELVESDDPRVNEDTVRTIPETAMVDPTSEIDTSNDLVYNRTYFPEYMPRIKRTYLEKAKFGGRKSSSRGANLRRVKKL